MKIGLENIYFRIGNKTEPTKYTGVISVHSKTQKFGAKFYQTTNTLRFRKRSPNTYMNRNTNEPNPTTQHRT